MLTTRARRFGPLAAGLAVVTLFGYLSQGAVATHTPADKVVANGSKLVVDGPNTEVSILTAKLRTSSPADLILQVSLECSIFTKLITGPSATAGATDTANATGSVRVWVEVDNVIVPVSDTAAGPHAGDDSDKATFCKRAYQRTVTDGEDPEDGQDLEEDYIDTKAAHAFNWLRLNLGNGIHTIVVKAELVQTTTGDATARVAIGNRTLIVEPAKLANDAAV